MIHTENLTKLYDGLVAVKDLNINVESGEIYGFLGPNGAGKTTTIMMLLGIVKPTRGKIGLFGKELKENYFEIKKKIGVVSEFIYLYEEMTGYEYLSFFADIYQVKDKKKRVDEVLELVNLTNRKHERLAGYSRGMQQKISIARALLPDPDLLIFDEPVASLDPYGILEVRDIIRRENARGKTFFISSHHLSEVERTCHRVGIINRGELLVEDEMEVLKKRLMKEAELEVELKEADHEIVKVLSRRKFVKEITPEERTLRIKTPVDHDYRSEISEVITKRGGIILSMKTKEMSLEDAFVTITEQNVSLLTKEGEKK